MSELIYHELPATNLKVKWLAHQAREIQADNLCSYFSTLAQRVYSYISTVV